MEEKILPAGVRRINDLSLLKQAIEESSKKTLVIFDIDEVLITSEDQILYPSYRKYREIYDQEIINKYGKDKSEFLKSIIHKAKRRSVVDHKIFDIINLIQRKNLEAIALTHSSVGRLGQIEKFEEFRIAQLKSFNIDFEVLCHRKTQISLPEMKSAYGVPIFKNGVIFTCYVDKGEILSLMLEKMNIVPDKIIFIDDKIENINSVAATCAKSKIEFVGFEYILIEDRCNKPLNEERARLQFETLAKQEIWLSDLEAGAKLDLLP